MKHFLCLATLVVASLWANAGLADVETSRDWFERLTVEERLSIQTNLVLLGHYDKLVDGEFGPGTYNALCALQTSVGERTTGVLSPFARSSLFEQGTAVADRLGLELVEDERSQTALFVPREVVQDQSDADNGLLFRAEDESVTLSTFGYVESQAYFRSLYETMILEAPPTRVVSYKFFSADRLVVSGNLGNQRTYLFARYSSGMIRGFSLMWQAERDSDASVIAMLDASFSMPLEEYRATEPPVEQPAPSLPANPPASPGLATDLDGIQLERMGALAVIGDNEDVVILDGEIASSTPLELLRALKARPNAKYLLLNSPGGLVDAGLLMAHEVRQRGLTTVVPKGFECVSACSFIFFGGQDRLAVGSLGVHQVWNQANDLVSGQEKLSDVLEALNEFGVNQQVISIMLRTPPQDMHIFDDREKQTFGINTALSTEGLSSDGHPLFGDSSTDLRAPKAPKSAEDTLKADLQAALDNYQVALNLAAAGDRLSAETYARNATARLDALCTGAGYADIPSCIGSDLPPLAGIPKDVEDQLRQALSDRSVSGGYVQLASFPSKATALFAASNFEKRLLSALPHALTVKDVNMGSKGIWYRVVLEVRSYQEAVAQCAALKAAGTDCIPLNGP